MGITAYREGFPRTTDPRLRSPGKLALKYNPENNNSSDVFLTNQKTGSLLKSLEKLALV